MTVNSPSGRVLRDERGIRLEFVRSYDEPSAEVWSALTESDRMARWFGTWTGDPAPGQVTVHMTEDEGSYPQTATILECDPPSRLVVDLPSPDGTWRLSAALTEREGTTTLVFIHRLAEPYDATGVGPGWHYYLDRLGAVVSGAPVPDVWDDYWPALREAYPLPT
ncbi:hypothetical protein BH20ACT5_BH20ACT5_01480 [soil metagenome]